MPTRATLERFHSHNLWDDLNKVRTRENWILISANGLISQSVSHRAVSPLAHIKSQFAKVSSDFCHSKSYAEFQLETLAN